MKHHEPWVTLTVDVACARCGRTLHAGEPARRTRGIMRHQGTWVGKCCDT